MPSGNQGNIPAPPPFESKKLEIKQKDVNVDKSALFQVVYFFLSVLVAPVTFPIYVMIYAVQQAKNISLVIIQELNKVVALGWNVVELCLLVTKSANILLFKDGNTKPLMPEMMDVYTKMANTLTNIHALPSTLESGTLIHLMLDRLPKGIWETLLPYPHPFFRGSVTQVSKTETNDLIVSTEEIPHDQYRPVGPREKKIRYVQ